MAVWVKVWVNTEGNTIKTINTSLQAKKNLSFYFIILGEKRLFAPKAQD